MQKHDLGRAPRRRGWWAVVVVVSPALVILGLAVRRGTGVGTAATQAFVPVGLALVVGVLVVVAGSRRAHRRADAVSDATTLEQAAAAPLLARVAAPEDATTLPALQPGAQAADPFHNLTLWWEAETGRGPVGPVVVAALSSGTTAAAGAAHGPGTEDTDAWWAANLAIALAGTGRSTLLVDGRMGDRFGPVDTDTPDTPGLHDVLTGTAFELALSQGPAPGLSVLPPGRAHVRPDAAMLETGFAAVAEQAGRRFDAVVVLAPALDQGADAQAMASHGSLLLVVPEGRAGLGAVRSRVAAVRSAGGRVAGVLLVDRPPTRAGW